MAYQSCCGKKTTTEKQKPQEFSYFLFPTYFSYPQWSHSWPCLSLPTESRTRASIAVPSFEHATSFKRPHSTISNSSTSSSSSQSSSSLLGSLNLHLYSSPSHPHTHALTSVPSFAQWPYDCIEEDELEQDTGSQPSMSEWLFLLLYPEARLLSTKIHIREWIWVYFDYLNLKTNLFFTVLRELWQKNQQLICASSLFIFTSYTRSKLDSNCYNHCCFTQKRFWCLGSD